LDDTSSYQGNSSLLVDTERGTTIRKKEYLPATGGEIYEMTFAAKKSATDDSSEPLLLIFKQSGEEIVREFILLPDGEIWQENTLYYQPESNVPVSLEITFRSGRTWIDDIHIRPYSATE
jgi:hypothetical protein